MRFPEFDGEWKKERLKDKCSFFSGGTPSSTNKTYYDGDIPFIRSGEIASDSTELFLSESGLNNSSAKIVEKGDLLLALYGATSGQIAISQIKGAINQAILCIRSPYDKVFLKSAWEKRVDKILQAYLQGGQGNLSAEIVKNLSFYFPSLQEQNKIGQLILLIDKRIDTQIRIIEDLRSLKVYIHNRIFSKGNTLFGQRNTIRLSDIATKITRKNKGNAINNVLSNSAAMGIVPQAEVFDKEIANENNTANYYVIGNGDFVYNPRKSAQAPFGPINMYKGQMEGIISPLYLCFQVTNINKNYLLHYFMSNVWYSYIYSNGDTGVRHDRVSIKDETFLDMPLYIHTIDKQQEIATMMNQVDAKIALEEIYLTKLQKQKDFLLAAMFV